MLPEHQRYSLDERGLLPFEITVEQPKRDSLGAYLRVLSRRRKIILATTALIIAVVMFLTLRQERIYEATTSVMVKGSDRALVNLDGTRASFTDADFKTEVKLLRTWPLLSEAARRAGMDLSSGRGIPVHVEGSNEDWLITISADSPNPEEAQRLANSVAAVYVERNLAQNRRRARAAREFLAGQQAEAQQSLASASRALRDYEAKNGALGLDVTTGNTVTALSAAETNYASAVMDRDAALKRAQMLRNSLRQTKATIVSTTSIARNPGIEKLQDTISDLSVQRAALLREYQPTSEKVRNVEAQLAQAKQHQTGLVRNILAGKEVAVNPVHQQLLGQLVDTEGQALTGAARAQGLKRYIQTLQNEVKNLPDRQYHLAQLQRNVQASEKSYLALRDRFQQMKVQEESTLSDAEIVEPALLPNAPVSPRPLLNFVLALISGLVIGVGLAALLDSLDNTVQSGQDVETQLDVPLLGAVADISDPAERLVQRAGGLSGVANAFRVIRSNVDWKGIDGNVRSVVVTSAFKGEGKSSTTANLGVVLSQTGKLVLIVDADNRNPTMHRHMGLPNTVGFSDVLEGTATIGDATQMTSTPNLALLSAGRMIENGPELLESPRFLEVLEEMKSTYDIILFDTPPYLSMVDSSIMASLVDGVVVVMASGKVASEAAQRMLHLLRKSRARILGITLNKVRDRYNRYGDVYAYTSGPGSSGGPYSTSGSRSSGSNGISEPNGTEASLIRLPALWKSKGPNQ